MFTPVGPCLQPNVQLTSTVLASLLPGLRQLRAPLAAGFIWLVTAWLGLSELIPHRDAATGVLRDVYDLAGVAGEAGLSATAGFVAYLLGILSWQLTAGLASVPARFRALVAHQGYRGRALPPPSRAGRLALAEAVVGELAKRAETDLDLKATLQQAARSCQETRPLEDDDVKARLITVRLDVDRYVQDLVADLSLMPLRLLDDDKKKDLYAEFDRRRAEAEFRAAVALPPVALAIVPAARASPWFALGLVLPLVLAVQSHLSAVSAADVLAESIRAREGVAGSPALDELRVGALRTRDHWLAYAWEKGYPIVAAAVEKAEGADKAEPVYRKQAEAGDADAMLWIAGHKHLRDDPTAKGWYEMAARAGNTIALKLQEIEAEPTVTPAEWNAIKSAYAGDEVKMRWAADVLLRIDRRDDAKALYRKALEKGYEDAREPLARLLDKDVSPQAGAALRAAAHSPQQVPATG
jgi:hypothetical protein